MHMGVISGVPGQKRHETAAPWASLLRSLRSLRSSLSIPAGEGIVLQPGRGSVLDPCWMRAVHIGATAESHTCYPYSCGRSLSGCPRPTLVIGIVIISISIDISIDVKFQLYDRVNFMWVSSPINFRSVPSTWMDCRSSHGAWAAWASCQTDQTGISSNAKNHPRMPSGMKTLSQSGSMLLENSRLRRLRRLRRQQAKDQEKQGTKDLAVDLTLRRPQNWTGLNSWAASNRPEGPANSGVPE